MVTSVDMRVTRLCLCLREHRMAEWLKKQADRDAEKEQRRLERIQRKLAEPRHRVTDTEYERQCHNLSERLEDSVLKGFVFFLYLFFTNQVFLLHVYNRTVAG